MTSGRPKVYLDTNIIQPLIYHSDDLSSRQFAAEIRDDLRGDVSDRAIDVVIPKPVIGELVDNFYEDLAEYGRAEVGTWSEFSKNLRDYLSQLQASFYGISSEMVSTANRLIDEDNRLAGTDAVIAASALEDNWSNHLITNDPDFHETMAIQTIERERQPTPRYYKLNVTDHY